MPTRLKRLRAGGRWSEWLAAGCAGAILLIGLRAAEPARVDFQARDIDGRGLAPAEPGARATVWVFLAHDCPICNAYAPELIRLQAAYAPKGVQWRTVYAEPDLGLPDLRAHARGYGLTMVLVADPDLQLAQACGVTVTPEVVVMDPQARLAYRGRIDDRWPELGHPRAHPQTHDLAAALDELLARQPVIHPRTVAVGCAIEAPLVPVAKVSAKVH
jgi:thiol-disulfide isomerase/thioredoxin